MNNCTGIHWPWSKDNIGSEQFPNRMCPDLSNDVPKPEKGTL
jgi:hypothetical protein